MQAAGALVLAAALLLQGCEREAVRTVVIPPGPPTGFAQPPAATASQAPAVSVPQTAAASAPQAATAPAAPEAGPPQSPAPASASPAAGTGLAGDVEGAQLLASRTLMVPVVGIAPDTLADHYDDARGKRVHEAIDIMAPAGRPVVAVDDGRIAKLFTSAGGGGLTVYHFDPQEQLAYYYAHLQSYAPGLREGATVRRGELIGYVGSSGNADPAAPHLHFAVFRLGPQKNWWEGEAVNPYPALRQAAPAPVATAGR